MEGKIEWNLENYGENMVCEKLVKADEYSGESPP